MTERHAMSRRDERANQIEAAGDFWRDGHDADVGPRGGDDIEDVVSREVFAGHGSPRAAFARPQLWRVSLDPRRRSKAFPWLRAAKLGIDEIAFQMRGQHARPAADALEACAADLIAEPAQCLGSARDGGRTERGHAVSRQP